MNDSERTVPDRIHSLHIKGFRSLADVQLDDIPNPMVLLGPNGAGKSNVLRFLAMLKAMFQYRLNDFVQQQGGADDQLFGGRKLTQQIKANVAFRTTAGSNRFSFALKHGNRDQFTVANEVFVDNTDVKNLRMHAFDGVEVGSSVESTFLQHARSSAASKEQRSAADMLGDCMFYQFHDTSDAAPIKMRWDAQDNHRLLEHGGNLAPILIHLKEYDLPTYNMICRHIPRVLPEFGGFELDADYGKTLLRWRTKTTGQTMGAHLTSDGTLRAFCLITLLNLPGELLPKIVLLDEPELGLHPFAISLVSHMARAMARERQVIIATQSPHFVDAFGLDEIVVLETRNGKTEVNRPKESFKDLLDEQTTGELWWSNLLGGHP